MNAGLAIAWIVCVAFTLALIIVGMMLARRGAWPRTPTSTPAWGAPNPCRLTCAIGQQRGPLRQIRHVPAGGRAMTGVNHHPWDDGALDALRRLGVPQRTIKAICDRRVPLANADQAKRVDCPCCRRVIARRSADLRAMLADPATFLMAGKPMPAALATSTRETFGDIADRLDAVLAG